MNNTFNCSTTAACSRNLLVRRWRLRGLTLVELMTCLAIMGVLAAVVAPSMSATIDSIRLTSASNNFLSALYLARGEAIKRNDRVVLCKSADGDSCSNSGGWEQGWIVFHDANGNAVHEAAESIVLRGQALPASLKLSGNLNVARYVSYTAVGTPKLVGGAFQAGTLTVCKYSLEGGEARQIILSPTGRSRVQKASVNACP